MNCFMNFMRFEPRETKNVAFNSVMNSKRVDIGSVEVNTVQWMAARSSRKPNPTASGCEKCVSARTRAG